MSTHRKLKPSSVSGFRKPYASYRGIARTNDVLSYIIDSLFRRYYTVQYVKVPESPIHFFHGMTGLLRVANYLYLLCRSYSTLFGQ